jgi:hypothetical protein
MKEILIKLFPTWIYWTAFVFTIAGVIYSIGKNLPWVCLLSVLPLLIALFDVAIKTHLKNKEYQFGLKTANDERANAERKLQQISAERLLHLEELVLRGSLQAGFQSIYEICAYIGRLQQLSKIEFNVRTIVIAGDSLYVAAKVSIEGLSRLKEDDSFVMFIKRSGLNHFVAKLRLHQVNEKQEAIFLKVTEELDKPTMESLRIFARGEPAKGIKDLGILPDVNIAAFEGHDMQSVTNALEILGSELEN